MQFPFKFKTNKPKLLDLFCKAGGCSAGYHRAGFEVFGVDIEPQKNYPFPFFQGDAIEFIRLFGHLFDVCHCSPKCQGFSKTWHIHKRADQLVNQIPETRQALIETGKPYVIENVPGSPLMSALVLCGTMFEGLRVQRHRMFETWPFVLWQPPRPCNHWGKVVNCRHTVNGKRVASSFEHGDFITVCGKGFKVADARVAMGIDWMTGNELSQAIPPAYTEFIGRELLKVMQLRAA
jgi:DNA (cytosine-5)-methyltransferase 1